MAIREFQGTVESPTVVFCALQKDRGDYGQRDKFGFRENHMAEFHHGS